MNILSMENITKSFGERALFDHTSFYLQEGEKVGVIGINGTGKSTLLKMMAGEEEPDEGSVTMANHVLCCYLPQNPQFAEEDTVLQAVLRKCRESGKDAYYLQQQEIEAKSMLTKLGVTDYDARCQVLSGGQRKRLALVAALLMPSDLLILDEPTNHLDNGMADWLEEHLKKRPGAVVMVTHDRYFLDSVSSRIIEIDKGNIYAYETNYSGYLELKAAREESAIASERKRQSILRKELEWVKRGARARTTKQKARLERYEALKELAAPIADGRVNIGSVASRLGKSTVELENISKSYGPKKLIRDFSYIFLKDDRVGFIGPNGCGKTTLMKIITGAEDADAGSVTIGQTVKLGYYAQEIEESEMPPDMRVIDFIKNIAEYVQTQNGSITASQMLERFLFEGKDQYGLIGKLSGGEKRRLHLLKVLMGAPNVFILDEPTNDLDITTLAVLEDYLDSFPGIVITVSHDRYFLDRTMKRIFAFEEDGTLKQYEGGYTEYSLKKAEQEEEAEAERTKKTGNASKNQQPASQQKGWKTRGPQKLKFTYQEQKDYETIESDIAKLEKAIEKLDADMLANATNSVKLGELLKEKEAAEGMLEEKMDRWMYLEELAARIEKQ